MAGAPGTHTAQVRGLSWPTAGLAAQILCWRTRLFPPTSWAPAPARRRWHSRRVTQVASDVADPTRCRAQGPSSWAGTALSASTGAGPGRCRPPLNAGPRGPRNVAESKPCTARHAAEIKMPLDLGSGTGWHRGISQAPHTGAGPPEVRGAKRISKTKFRRSQSASHRGISQEPPLF